LVCDLRTDANCSNALAAFLHALSDSEKRLKDFVTANISYHQVAESDCQRATSSLASAEANVSTAQRAWEGEKEVCQDEKLVGRNSKICTFGEQLQTTCEDLTKYSGDKGMVTGSGSDLSVEDRKREYNTTQMVLCLLREFVDNEALDDAKIDQCSVVDTSFLNLDLLEANVTAIQNTGDFKILCSQSEDIEFRGELKQAPVKQTLPVFDVAATSKSFEVQEVKPQYQLQPSWTETFTWQDQVEQPFAVCA